MTDDKNEHLTNDEILANVASLYNTENLTATNITLTGKIDFKNADGTITSLTNPGGKLLTSDSNINANGFVIGQSENPDWCYALSPNNTGFINDKTGKIKSGIGWQMYRAGNSATFPADINVNGPIIGSDYGKFTHIKTSDKSKTSVIYGGLAVTEGYDFGSVLAGNLNTTGNISAWGPIHTNADFSHSNQ